MKNALLGKEILALLQLNTTSNFADVMIGKTSHTKAFEPVLCVLPR